MRIRRVRGRRLIAGFSAVATVLTCAAPASAAFPGENGRLAASDAGTTGSPIFSYEPDGSGERLLDHGVRPAFSADGEKIIFSQSLDLFIADADGGNRVPLGLRGQSAAFSPDGEQIVFDSFAPSGGSGFHLYLANVDGTNVRQLTSGTDVHADPVFSPDGTKIYFESNEGIPVNGNDTRNIWMMNADGSGETPLTSTASQTVSNQAPDVSPDGTKIAYWRVNNGSCASNGCTIRIMDASGGGDGQLVSGNLALPTFSPDGAKILFVSEEEQGRLDLTTINPDGSGRRAVTNSSSSSGRIFLHTAWQPIPVCRANGAAGSATRRAGYYGAGAPDSMALRDRPPPGPLPAPRIGDVEPRSTIAGATVKLSGRGLAGERLRATVGGEGARLYSRNGRGVVVGLPEDLGPGKKRIRVRRGSHRASASVRIVPSFDGTLAAELDEAGAIRQSVGSNGGVLEATGSDGTSFRLSIPPGALAAETEVAMTPVARLTDSPFSGPAEGVELAPDGLKLASPATLTISRPDGFASNSIGFAMGESFELTPPAGSRERLTLELDHFSTHGAASAFTEEDAISSMAPLVDSKNALPLGQIRSLLHAVAVFDKKFSPPDAGFFVDGGKVFRAEAPPTFCQRNDICRRAFDKASSSIRRIMSDQCVAGKATPSLDALTALAELTAVHQLLAGEGQPFEGCAAEIGRKVATQVLDALKADPLARTSLPRLPRKVNADINGDRLTSSFESAKVHATAFGLLAFPNFPDHERDLLTELDSALVRILEDNQKLCENSATSDDGIAASRLREGHTYALDRSQLVDEYLAALAKCGVAVVINPQSVVLGFGGQQQFTAVVTSLDSNEQSGVVFSATDGSITPAGLYTAPDREGIFQVRATSTRNEMRFDTAAVTVTPGC